MPPLSIDKAGYGMSEGFEYGRDGQGMPTWTQYPFISWSNATPAHVEYWNATGGLFCEFDKGAFLVEQRLWMLD